jgi:cytochrome P450
MIRLLINGAGNALEQFFDKSGEMVITIDPPRHKVIKRTLMPSFNPRAVRSLEEDIRRMSNELLDQIKPGEPIDVVSKLSSPFSILVAVRVLGLKDQDLDEVGRWVTALEDLTRVNTVEEIQGAAADFASMGGMLFSEMERKQTEPGDDLFTVLLATELDGEPLRPEVVLAHVATFISNGGTTRAFLANILDMLARHPDQLQLLVENPDLIPGAVEEVLRLEPSARGFSRLVLEDTEVHGKQIKAGQYIYLMYSAANRDENAFVEPDRFDVTRRSENLHTSFGFGTHSCLGQPLVRLEIAVFMQELLKRYTSWSRAAEPTRYRHPQMNAWSDLLLTFH